MIKQKERNVGTTEKRWCANYIYQMYGSKGPLQLACNITGTRVQLSNDSYPFWGFILKKKLLVSRCLIECK